MKMKPRPGAARTPAVLVVGLPGSGKSTFIRRHTGTFRRRAEVAVVDDTQALARRLRLPSGNRPLVIEARGQLEPLDLMDVFLDEGPEASFFLSHVIAVVDAPRFFRVLHDEATDDGPDQTPAERLANQIELASAVALENTGQLRAPTDDARIRDVIRSLNPSAHLDAPGWAGLSPRAPSLVHPDTRWLAIPPSGSVAVEVFKYQARRPFHPARLAATLEVGWTGVLRTKGFVWIASRGDERGVYIQAGRTWRLDAAGPWWASVPQDEWPDGEDDVADIRAAWNIRTGDRRQELVFVGLGLRPERIRRDLDACLLSPCEFSAGAGAWRSLPDPLPSWDGSETPEVHSPAASTSDVEPRAVE